MSIACLNRLRKKKKLPGRQHLSKQLLSMPRRPPSSSPRNLLAKLLGSPRSRRRSATRRRGCSSKRALSQSLNRRCAKHSWWHLHVTTSFLPLSSPVCCPCPICASLVAALAYTPFGTCSNSLFCISCCGSEAVACEICWLCVELTCMHAQSELNNTGLIVLQPAPQTQQQHTHKNLNCPRACLRLTPPQSSQSQAVSETAPQALPSALTLILIGIQRHIIMISGSLTIVVMSHVMSAMSAGQSPQGIDSSQTKQMPAYLLPPCGDVLH